MNNQSRFILEAFLIYDAAFQFVCNSFRDMLVYLIIIAEQCKEKLPFIGIEPILRAATNLRAASGKKSKARV